MIHIYGIPNCDTVKKARVWADKHGLAVTFHDYKKEGADPARIAAWIAAAGLDVVVNRKGTTWRNLTDERKAAIVDADSALALMLENPSVIKRPVVQGAGLVTVGFSPAAFEEKFGAAP